MGPKHLLLDSLLMYLLHIFQCVAKSVLLVHKQTRQMPVKLGNV